MATKNIVPNANGEGEIGTSSKYWSKSHINTITVGTSVVPDAQDGAALGTTSLQFSDLFLADSSVIGFGDDNDTTLTHTDGSGLTLNSTNKLMFNDASQFIQGSSATVLSLGATDEIDLTATAIDVNGTIDVSGDATFASDLSINGGDLTFSADQDATISMSQRNDGGRNLDIGAGFAGSGGGTNSDGGNLTLRSGGSKGTGTSTMHFRTAIAANGYGATTEQMKIDAVGDVSITNNLFIGSGKAIYVGGTAAANELDDYEEGTWTPTITKGSLIGGTIDVQLGKYIKVGNVLYITFYWYQASGNAGTTSGSSSWILGGIPFSILHGTYSFIPSGYGLISSTTTDIINARWQVNSTGTNADLYGNGVNMDNVNNDGNAMEFSATGVLQCS